MPTKHPNAQTPILIQPSSWKLRAYDANEETKARQIIRDEVLLKRNEPYYQVRARIKYANDGKAQAIIAYMLRANSYTADVVEIKMNESYGAVSIKEGADVIDDEDATRSVSLAASSFYADVDMVCATCLPEYPTAKAAVEAVAAAAQRAGLRVRTLLGAEATVAAYQTALSSGVRAFFNVGHGYSGGIVVADGNITATWFNMLTGRQVSPAVVYFNSCQVFNPPLLPAVMAAGARTFVGGIVNLLVGPSEEVAKSFWTRVLEQNEEMGTALASAEQANYPVVGAHGITGDLGVFGATANQVTVYEHADYGGRFRSFDVGRYDLAQLGLPNDCISSIRVPDGFKVTLYEHAGFAGSSITYTADSSFVGSFNDQTSSLVVELATSAPAVDIYEHYNYQGMRKQLGIGRYNLDTIGLPNDCLSSLRVGRGLQVTLFEHRDFRGASVTYRRSTSSVGSFNDMTSSIVVEPAVSRVIEIFEHADYQGRCKILGLGSFNLAAIGLPNDSLSSLRVPAGLKVTLYEHADFRGASVTYTRDTNFVGSFNDKTSSIRVGLRTVPTPPIPNIPEAS